jgi:hypothetical protein
MAIGTHVERRVLALLEEAGEEDIATLVNTVINSRGLVSEIQVIRSALNSLLMRGLIEIARSRDETTRQWIAVSREQAVELLQQLTTNLNWSDDEQIWKWQHGLPRAETVLTSAGVVAANNVLREDGWLDNAIDLT